MIPELTWFALLCVAVIIVLGCLAESGKLEDYSEKRHVDKLADKSRKQKTGIRRANRWRPYNCQRKAAAWHG